MRRSSSILSALLIAAMLFGFATPHLQAASSRPVFDEAISVSELKTKYEEAPQTGDRIRILIMPGHEPNFGGAEFMGYYERELVVYLAEKLKKELETDPRFEVLVARGTNNWNSDFRRYFDRQERKIENFIEDHKEEMEKLVKRGRIDANEGQVAHNTAPSDVAARLYGITKWSNEHDVDLMLHLHLNDETSHGANERGVHSGLAIYIPDDIYGNAKASRAVAESVFARLNDHTATSTLPLESVGIVEDRELIAVGAYNTSEVPSLLLEYGYLYEPRLTGDGARDAVLADFAYHTSLGVKDFFGSASAVAHGSRALPYTWTTDPLATTTASTTPDAHAIYALQAALRDAGVFPAPGMTLSQCPISGIAGTCTTEALKAFQTAKGLEATGTLGPQTRLALNKSVNPSLVVAPAPVTGSCSLTATLALESSDADTGGEVTALQRLLAKDPTLYPEGLVTGYFGPATESAVKRFQEKHGLAKAGDEGHGFVGPKTRAALSSTCAAS